MTSLDRRMVAAQQAIAVRFRTVVTRGAQSQGLPNDLYVCGQYLDQMQNTHRGFHGTVAAMSVLASSHDSDNDPLVKGLLEYTDRVLLRADAGSPLPGLSEDDGVYNREDVIKQSELLRALPLISAAVVQTEPLTQSVSDRLLEGKAAGGVGWSYFTDDAKPPEPLPTAFAVSALCAHGYTLSEEVAWLMESFGHGGRPDVDVFVQAACLYFLVFLPDRNRPPLPELAGVFSQIWSSVENLLEFDLEANIEYARPDTRSGSTRERGPHFYVRVPWQLYLIGAAAAFRSPFASYRLRKRFDAVLLATVSSSGFVYPHSGRRLSSRTHGILYELIDRVRGLETQSGLLTMLRVSLDGIRTYVLTRGRVVLRGLGLVLLVWVSWAALSADGLASQVVVALLAEVGAALLLILLGAGRRS